MDETLFAELDFLQKTLDAIPSILLVVDSDVSIHYMNSTASQKLGLTSENVYMKRGGEVMHCVHSFKTPDGCGRAEFCKDCIIRNSVNKSIEGMKVYREKTRIQIKNNGNIKDIYLLVTSSPIA